MTIEENKAVVLCHMKEVLEQGKVELIDSCYAPDGSAADMPTPEEWKERVLFHHQACPGFKVTILNLVGEGETVWVHWQAELTYSVPVDPEPIPFYPLGKPVFWRIMNIFRVVGGKIVSEQSVNGYVEMLVGNGVNPSARTVQNKKAALKFIDALNHQDYALLEEVSSPEVTREWKEVIPWIYTAMRNHKIEVVEITADDESVAMKLATSGYHTGEVHGIPATGNWWTNRVFVFFWLVEGKVVEVDSLPDTENFIKQVGGAIKPVTN